MNHKIRAKVLIVLLIANAIAVYGQDDALDFTTGEFETIGPIKAKADRPQVKIFQTRVEPEFKKYDLPERSFLNEVLKSVKNSELNKKFDKKVIKIEEDQSK